jgi:uncharacterized protein (TIGR02444 family)
MSLWDWAVKVHGSPGMDEALLELQDDHGQCVSFLLWAAWSAGTGRVLAVGDMAHAATLARGWEGDVTAPLRAVRRALKRPRPWVLDTDREALRTAVKDSELNAERRLLDALEALSPEVSGGQSGDLGDIAAALQAASAAWMDAAPALTLDRLAQMVESVAF